MCSCQAGEHHLVARLLGPALRVEGAVKDERPAKREKKGLKLAPWGCRRAKYSPDHCGHDKQKKEKVHGQDAYSSAQWRWGMYPLTGGESCHTAYVSRRI